MCNKYFYTLHPAHSSCGLSRQLFPVRLCTRSNPIPTGFSSHLRKTDRLCLQLKSFFYRQLHHVDDKMVTLKIRFMLKLTLYSRTAPFSDIIFLNNKYKPFESASLILVSGQTFFSQNLFSNLGNLTAKSWEITYSYANTQYV